MKKYYPVDFDEKGKAVLGKAKDTPTSNGFIPTTWVPGGGSEDEGDGLKSITISPAITTTPALDSLFPIYYDDLTEEQKRDGVSLVALPDEILQGQHTVTITPTSDWYIADGEAMEFQGKGEPITIEVSGDNISAFVVLSNETTQETTTQYFSVTLSISD